MWPNRKPFLRASNFDGVFPIHADWPQELTPEDVKQIINFVIKNRRNSNKYDVIISGNTPNNASEGIKIIQPYEKVGVTWWCENIDLFRFKNSEEKMLERILQGPPRESN
jgi:hypothetical protein